MNKTNKNDVHPLITIHLYVSPECSLEGGVSYFKTKNDVLCLKIVKNNVIVRDITFTRICKRTTSER